MNPSDPAIPLHERDRALARPSYDMANSVQPIVHKPTQTGHSCASRYDPLRSSQDGNEASPLATKTNGDNMAEYFSRYFSR
jgi:hypothetical protein